MRKALIIFAALMIIFSISWAQETTPSQEKPPAAAVPPQPGQAQQPQDAKYTNDSVARVSFVEGKTFIQRASDLGFEEGVLNMPISEGDRLGTADGRMEVHFGRGNYIRLDNDSKLDILNLPKKGDDIARMRVWSGSAYLVVGTLAKEKGIEIHTADSSFYVLDKGIFRINVRENHDTEVLVFRGLIEVAGEGGSTLVKADQRLEVSEGRFSGKPSPFMAVADDAFDRFNQSRNSELGQQFAGNAKRYLPEDLGDYESELDQNGEWRYVPPYGDVWTPNGIDADWRPYWNGRWVWLGLSGWTWMPYDPWGWVTFHYGRWHWGMDLGWYWIPMSMWGPGWVNWWWDDFYFGWAPMSYWGYPGILMGNRFYGGYYGAYYPSGSRALTVVRRDQLKAPNASRVAVRDTATLGSLTKMSLSSRTVNLRPSGTKISVQPINGNRVMLRKDGSSGGLVPDRGGIARPSGQGSSGTSIKRNDGSQGKSTGAQGKSGNSGKSAPARSSGSSKSSGSGARRIRKSESMSAAPSALGGYGSSVASSSGTAVRGGAPQSVRTYPSSPAIHSPNPYYGDGGAGRARSFSGGNYYGRSSSGIYRSSPSSRSGGSSGRITSRSGSSSGRSSSGRSSGSVSRGSSGSHSSGGGARRR
jgi:hypothetical protein